MPTEAGGIYNDRFFTDLTINDNKFQLLFFKIELLVFVEFLLTEHVIIVFDY